jgi:hypothetical protein
MDKQQSKHSNYDSDRRVADKYNWIYDIFSHARNLALLALGFKPSS